MDILLSRVFAGMTSGSIYILIALALVVVFRSSSTINFAQGEFALFTTYVAWWLTERGLNIWVVLLPVIILGFIMGALAERFLIRPVRKRDETAILIIGLGLFTGLNGLDGWIWGSDEKVFPNMFPSAEGTYFTIMGARLHYDSLLVMITTAAVVLGLTLLFTRTNLGLQMRAVATSPESAALCGIKVGRILTLSWGLSAAIGSLAGVMLVPTIPPGQLNLASMFHILIFAAAAALLGGLDSIKGAVVGGLILGVGLALINGYVSFIGGTLSLTFALIVIVLVLTVRPTGLFGTRRLERV
ncbi:branched-chain amino acid ABC transporter, permease protein [Aeromicrobium marinum DSM 15272]|uniref:Branched-chain amino acid ABC transporter, permease protein n=1 Tax=Aeromicrobium marinum DSM 15272 TaxID=585531 RepID=E2S826_9ACTN|nr:branched-chain amino acid ABC transporter permease [Aeromicrobium marinum]EFQ84842.1 branched-chain amino acid ABC transporter, permease protein [Aeromicrobium marinum DSM 15272]